MKSIYEDYKDATDRAFDYLESHDVSKEDITDYVVARYGVTYPDAVVFFEDTFLRRVYDLGPDFSGSYFDIVDRLAQSNPHLLRQGGVDEYG